MRVFGFLLVRLMDSNYFDWFLLFVEKDSIYSFPVDESEAVYIVFSMIDVDFTEVGINNDSSDKWTHIYLFNEIFELFRPRELFSEVV